MARRSLLAAGTISIVLLALAMFGCSTGPKANQAKAPYKLGVLMDVTGPMAPFGKDARDGMQLALDEVNQKGGINGRQVQAVLYDGESDDTKSVLGYKKLSEVDKVLAVGGPANSTAAVAMLDTVAQSETANINSASSVLVWQPTKKWVFNVVAGTNVENQKMAKYLKDKGYTRVAYEYVDTVMGQTEYSEFKKAADAQGITVVDAEKHGPNDKDMTPQITKMKGANPQAMVVSSTLADGAVFYQNMKQLGVNLPRVNNYSIGFPNFPQLAGDASEGLVFPMGRLIIAKQLPDSDPLKPLLVNLTDTYQAKYGRPVSQLSSTGYDIGRILVNGLQHVSPGLDPDKDVVKLRAELRDKIEQNTKNFTGANGIFNYTADNHNGLGPDAYVMIVIEGGQFKFLNP